ncbi:hypothetical protein K788_00002615 [Paraburkholderia caribensis MBA4]|uniref:EXTRACYTOPLASMIC FUNCTION ALTERNATIVE SIGMA FACTOR n=1 Tax=Paraburkholderia caribensis MBA4 TaxID=1323664 RepID=A0A0N7JV78_9BURK|nr:DUF1109 domain-containing protein [Paraburkholderia caribensis]ALL68453.1 hypothetical protein K788_00002615 [Paraburkholderia caribensis MBA4]
MKTDELIDLLSRRAEPVDNRIAVRQFAQWLPLAALGSLLMMRTIYGLRPDLPSAAQTGLFWAKLALPACIAIGALIITTRLSRPGAKVGAGWLYIVVPLALVWLGGGFIVGTAAPQDRSLLILGISWRSCPFNILLLSVPGVVATFLAVMSLAPTNLRLAGASAGLLASSIATIAYCFHCPEMSPAFWSIWYVLGMGLVAAIGAALGPRLLRW